MAKPQVTLTFAGDSAKLEQAFGRVGDSAKGMSTEVSGAGMKVRDAGQGFDRAGEAADTLDTRMMGARDMMTGVEDTGRGLAEIMKGNVFDGALLLGMGFGDLGSGLYNFVIPSLKQLSKGMITSAVSTVRATASTVGHGIATKAAAVGTGALTIAQRGLNLAMRANPIGLVITALFAVGAALVLAWKKSETFRKIVTGALRGIVAVAKGVGSAIAAPFRAGFRAVRSAWNSTIGGKGFSIPDWVPIIGGKTFRIPRMHTGGRVPGPPGSEHLAILQAGEEVTPAGGGGAVIEIRSGGSALDDLLVELLAGAIRMRGGNVQAVLGGTP